MKPGFLPLIEKTFRFRDAKWKPIMSVKQGDVSVKELYRVVGPLCLEDSAKLDFANDNETIGNCPVCEREYKLSKPPQPLRELAHRAYQAALDNELETISLDDPIQPIKARDEDASYWVEVKLGHANDGRKIAVVYIGDKKRNKKLQNFIDLDNEQLRGDRANAKPHEVVSKITAEFINSKHEISKK